MLLAKNCLLAKKCPLCFVQYIAYIQHFSYLSDTSPTYVHLFNRWGPFPATIQTTKKWKTLVGAKTRHLLKQSSWEAR